MNEYPKVSQEGVSGRRDIEEDAINEKRLDQGENASKVFEGKAESEAVRMLYSESARDIAEIIGNRITNKGKEYSLADFGAHKGELLKNILALLSGYHFHTIGIDLEKNLRTNDSSQEKVVADLSDMPFEDASIDLGIARYILVWNNPEKQREILKELSRVTRDFVIIQHAGADNEAPDAWRDRTEELFSGEKVPKLERHGHFFSSREEIEKWMKEGDIPFERISERRVDGVSNVFIERFGLDEKDAQATREILGDKDYIIQTTWILLPSEKGKEK